MKIKSYGGLDFQLLGIGRTGHIGFNAGSNINSGTRSITLDHITRIDAASSFIDNVPRKFTMGIGTVRRAKELYLAWGISKAEILKDTIEGENSSKVPQIFAGAQ
jgi:glucosamine-6-phosphate deaminase